MDFSYDIDTITKDAVVIVGDRMRAEKDARLGRLLDDAVGVSGQKNRAYVRVDNDLEATIAIYPVGFDLALLEKDAPVKVKLQNGDYVVTGVSPKLGAMFWADNVPGASLNFATLVLGTANPLFPNAQVLGSLATGLLKNTTGAGALSIAVAGTDYAAATHTHQSSGQGGQLDAGLVFNAGTVPLVRGGGAASFAGLSTGALVAKLASSLGAATLTANAIMIGGASGVPSFLAPGTSGNLAQSNGTTWTSTAPSFNASVITAGILSVPRGGTGAATFTANVVLLGNGTSALQEVAPGSSGNVLTSNGTTWTSAAPASGFAGLVDDGTDIRLATNTDTFTVGGTGENLGRLTVRGVADAVQLAVRANGTQTNSVVLITNSAAATLASISNAGKLYLLDEIEIDGAFNHDGSTFGALGAAPAAQQAQTVDLKDALVTFGFYSGSGGATPIDTDEGLVTAFFQAEASTTSRASINVPNATAAPSSPVEGDIWYDGTQEDFKTYVNTLTHPTVKGGFYKTDTTTIANSAAETSIVGTISGASNTLPANWWKVGKTVSWDIAGTFNVASGTPTLQIRLKYSTVSLATLTSAALSFSGTWRATATSTCRSVGASGTVETALTFIIAGAMLSVTTLATIDTTSSLALTVTLQNSAGTNFTTTGTNLDVDMKN